MISLKIDNNFFFRIFNIFFFLILFNTLFYILVENVFLYSFVEIINNINYYISIFFLFIFYVFFCLFFRRITNIINIQILKFNLEKNLKILQLINIIGISLFLLFKLLPFFLLYSPLADDVRNLNCILIEAKNFTYERENLFIGKSNFFYLLLNKFSWVGTALLNVYYVIIFYTFFFFNNLGNKYKLTSLILILLSIFLYLIFTGSKIILLSSLIVLFISLSFSYSFYLMSFRKFLLIFLFAFVLLFFSYLISQLARTACIKKVENEEALYEQKYDSSFEFNRKIFFKKADSKINYINYLRTLINNNITINYSLFYVLSGKLSGDFLLYKDNNNKINAGSFIYLKQINNKIKIDLEKLGIKYSQYYEYDQNFIERLNPIVSLYHMLYRDFAYLNLSFLLFIFIFIFLQFIFLKNIYSFFFFIYFMLVLFYSSAGVGFANLLATFNTNIIFFNFFVFFIFFFLKTKILIK
jgi:hypothetical protein